MTEIDIRNSLRALAHLGTKSDERRMDLFNRLILSDGKVKIAQTRKLDSRARTTLVLEGWEIVLIADVLKEYGAYARSRFYHKMQLFKLCVMEDRPLKHAWGNELRRRKEERWRLKGGAGREGYDDDEEDKEDLDPVEIAEKRGYRRKFGE